MGAAVSGVDDALQPRGSRRALPALPGRSQREPSAGFHRIAPSDLHVGHTLVSRTSNVTDTMATALKEMF